MLPYKLVFIKCFISACVKSHEQGLTSVSVLREGWKMITDESMSVCSSMQTTLPTSHINKILILF